ncbi:MAG: T9SS type A sorting domain-containing protein [Bacteroidota bacterium]
MKALKTILLAFLSISIVFASNSARQEKLKEEREARTTAQSSELSSVLTASSDWIPVTVGISSLTMKSINFLPSGVVWASGYSGATDYVFYSGNNGGSWSTYALPTTINGGWTNLSAANDSVAIISNYDGKIFRTENKGAKWDTVFSYSTPDTAFFDGVKFSDATTAYAVGDADWFGMMIAKSTDGGKTWNRMTNIPTEVQGVTKTYSYATFGKALDVVGNNVWVTYYMATGTDRVGVPLVRTTDGGATWTHVVNVLTTTVANNYYFRSVSFKDANNGWAIGRQASSSSTLAQPLYKTTDGGVTWGDSIQIEAGVPLTVNKVRNVFPISGTNTVVAVGTSGSGAGSWISTDGGATFTKLMTPYSGYFNSVDGKDASTMVGGGSTGLYKYGKSVKVTFNVNTAGIPDTLKTNSFVQVRGGSAQLTWDNNSPTKMTNIGGDYWTFSGYYPSGDTIPYKYFTNVKSSITGADNGWEANTSNWGNGNRRLVVGSSDTTLPLEYANGFKNNSLQTDAPFATGKTDTVVMYLRVNMQAAIQAGVFDPAKHKVAVRGSFTAADWGTSVFLSPQGSHANGGQTVYDGNNIYVVPIYFNKTAIQTTPFHVLYKFVVHNINGSPTDDWSVLPSNVEANRGDFDMPAKDTTIAWVWYNNAAYIPPVGKDTINVKFHTDLTTAIANKGFEAGDTIVVHYGYNNTASATLIDTLKKVGLSGNIYESPSIKVTGVAVGMPLQYQYYHVKYGTEVRENYFDFTDKAGSSSTEKRKAPVSANNATFTQFDTSKSGSNAHRVPNFPSSKKLTKNVLVTFTCDLRPAYYQLVAGDSIYDTQGAFRTLIPSDKDSVYNWGVWINGPAVGGWGNSTGNEWGVGLRANTAKKMYDDATHGDAVAGDHIYSMQVQYYKDSVNNTIGQVFKFGVNGGDNEGGSASGYGNNHSANIDDATSTATIATDFGSINPLYYTAWDYDNHKTTLGVQRLDETVPNVFALDQNYPNPFNPSTTIKYSIPAESRVTLTIFNLLGQEVATVVNENLKAGKYSATFDASRLATGVYIYRLEAGSFTSVKKMMLLK